MFVYYRKTQNTIKTETKKVYNSNDPTTVKSDKKKFREIEVRVITKNIHTVNCRYIWSYNKIKSKTESHINIFKS